MRTQRSSKQTHARHDRRRADKARTRFALGVEPCEERTLLSGLGFLQGVVFQDVSGSGQLNDPSGHNTPLAGAQVKLFDASNIQVGSTETTVSDGSYLFTGLTPGTYTITETPPAGYLNKTTQTNSPLDPVLSSTPSSISVNVLDPTQYSVTFNSNDEFYVGGNPSNPQKPYAYVTFTATGISPNPAFTIAPLPITVQDGTGGPTLVSEYPSYCADIFNSLTTVPNVNVFNANGTPGSATLNANNNAGQIGYLFNHYANAPGLTNYQIEGLQLAIWKLEYDPAGTSFTSGNVKDFLGISPYTSPTDMAGILSAASAFIADAAGKSEPVIYLNVNGVTQPVPKVGGLQGVLASGELNFADVAGHDTITGTKFLDVSGNGLGANNAPLAGDTTLAGVTINLYSSPPTSNSVPIATATTNANGNYSFTGLTPGTYYVGEGSDPGYVQTGPSAAKYYTVNLTSPTQTVTAENFANYHLAACTVQNVSYSVTTPSGSTSTTTSLNGHTQQGDTVTATFTVPAGQTETVSLVAYTAPDSYFNANDASQQHVYDYKTDTNYGPGTYSLTVHIPNCDYQIDFVCGAVIDHLGPAGSNVFYHPQQRFISGDNGGTNSCDTIPLLCGQTATIGFFQQHNPNGTYLILNVNGGPTSTQLGTWLATSFPNLFGALNGATNQQVDNAYETAFKTDKTFAQVFDTALALYLTDSNLAGNIAAAKGFIVTTSGTGASTFNVGSDGAAFGVANNANITIMTLLVDLNNQSSSGLENGHSSLINEVNTIFDGINQAGDVGSCGCVTTTITTTTTADHHHHGDGGDDKNNDGGDD